MPSPAVTPQTTGPASLYTQVHTHTFLLTSISSRINRRSMSRTRWKLLFEFKHLIVAQLHPTREREGIVISEKRGSVYEGRLDLRPTDLHLPKLNGSSDVGGSGGRAYTRGHGAKQCGTEALMQRGQKRWIRSLNSKRKTNFIQAVENENYTGNTRGDHSMVKVGICAATELTAVTILNNQRLSPFPGTTGLC